MAVASKPVFVFDTSGLMEAFIRQTSPEVFPVLWDAIDEQIEASRIIAPDAVLQEIMQKTDALAKWAKRRKAMFQMPDEAEQHIVRDIMRDYPTLVDHMKNKSGADPWVIAKAKSIGGVVVHAEDRGKINKVKIPNVCDGLGIEHCRPLDMYKRLGFRFG